MEPLNNKEDRKVKTPSVVGRLVFTYYDGNAVKVEGVPPNLQTALAQMNAAIESIVRLFVSEARKGRVDDTYSIVRSKIVPGNVSLVGPDGERLT